MNIYACITLALAVIALAGGSWPVPGNRKLKRPKGFEHCSGYFEIDTRTAAQRAAYERIDAKRRQLALKILAKVRRPTVVPSVFRRQAL